MVKQLQFKMLLLLCALMVGSGSAWADTVTFSYEDYKGEGTTSNGSEYTMVKTDVSIKNTKFFGNNSQAHFYANGVSTITPADGVTITKMELTATATNYNGYQSSGTVTASTGTVSGSTSSTTVTWTGSASSAFTISNNKQIRWTSIVVTYTTSGGGSQTTTYSVTYNANGATSGSVPEDDTEYDNGAEVTVLGNNNLAKTNHTFAGWNTSADGKGTSYAAGAKFNISANTTLYAQWTLNTYNVTLPTADTYGTYTMDATNPVAYGTTVTLTYTPASGYDNYEATWSVNGTAIVENTFTMPDEAVTVTVSVEKSMTRNMTIDFESAASTYTDWTFSNISTKQTNSGVTAHGGSYMGATNSTETAYVQTKEKVNPVSLTCYVSKQSTSTASSTWYIQVSSDGSTWTNVANRSASDMTKGDWKEFSAALNSYSDVYVRVYYSGSTAVRNIDDLTLVVAIEPSITVTPATANPAASDVEGTMAIAYENLTISDMDDFDVQFYDANEQELNGGNIPDWIEVLVAEEQGGGYVVSYTMDANNGAARTAYFKVYAMEDQTNYVYSNLVTVTQAAYVAPPTPGNWVLTNLADLTPSDVFVIVGTLDLDDEETYALPNDGGTSAPFVHAVTVENNTLSGDIAANLQWNLSGNATDGYTFYPNGDDDNWLYCSTTANSSSNNNIKVGTGDRNIFVQDGNGLLVTNDDYTGRYLSIYVNSGTAQDWRGYTSYSSAPVISFYKKVSTATSTATITLNAACTDGSMVYGTYSNSSAFVVSDDIVVAEVGIKGGKLNVKEYETGAVVPANTGVMVSALDGGNYTVNLSTEAGTSVLGDDNCLRATGDAGISAADMAAADANCLFYRLTMHEGTQIGFWWGAAEGAAFSLAANKAYLAVPKTINARQGFAFGDGSTGISTLVNSENVNGEVFDLQGRRVAQPTKGLYIVNGKKVLVK